MYKLTVKYETKAGVSKYRDFEAKTRQAATVAANKKLGTNWEFYAGKHIVSGCAQSSDVANIMKYRVL